jgi:raffinose/stachyose/melibiose transport system permease protein
LLLGVFTSGVQKYRAALAVLYFVPLLLSSAAVAIAFKALLDPNFGMGPGLGMPALTQDWLGNSDLVLFVVVFVIAWQFVPFHTLIYQGGVRQIPASLYEAAQIDGAGRIKQFFHVTLPQLKYTMITSSTLMVVGSLAYFDLIFVLTAGGPGYSTRLLPLHMYLTGFKANDMGAASALGVILVVIGLVLALLLQRLGGGNRSASQLEGA